MADELRNLCEKKGQLVAESRKLLEENPGDKWNAELEARYTEMITELNSVAAKIDAGVAAEETRKNRVAELEAIEQRHKDAGNGKPANIEYRSSGNRPTMSQAIALQAWMRAGEGQDLTPEHRSACHAVGINPNAREIVLRNDYQYCDPVWSLSGANCKREIRAGLDVGTGGAGQETIPQGFLAEIDRKMLAFGGPKNVCRVMRTATGNALPIPKVDDTSNTGEQLDEATSVGTSVDPTFSAVTLNAYKYSSKAVLVSAELLQDSAFNMADIVASLLGERLGRITGQRFTTGTGSGQPEGIVTGSVAGKTAASTTAFTPDELKDLFHSVDPAYRSGTTGWMMNDAVLQYLSKFKDSNGQYMWQPGLSVGSPDLLINKPITINQHMSSTFTTAQKLVLFGDYSHFMVRDVGEIRFKRLDERYADTDQVGFFAFYRGDSAMIQSAAVKHLKLA